MNDTTSADMLVDPENFSKVTFQASTQIDLGGNAISKTIGMKFRITYLCFLTNEECPML
jgi:hypothetical protein